MTASMESCTAIFSLRGFGHLQASHDIDEAAAKKRYMLRIWSSERKYKNEFEHAAFPSAGPFFCA